jgi:phosphoglycerate dehydrogenase-like enzyme
MTSSARPRILFTTEPSPTRDAYFTPAIIATLEHLGDVDYNEGSRPLTETELADRLRGVDICITHWGCPPFTPDVMRSADRLKLIAHAAGSVGDLVTPAVYERGVAVTTANSAMAAHVAEGTLALLLADLHRVIDRAELMRNGGWLGHAERRTASLSTITIGLVGLGDIGKRLLQLLAPFGTSVLVHDPFVTAEEIEQAGGRSAPLDELLMSSDVISLHAALTPQNRGMLNAERLALIGDGALLINTARSGLIDSRALEQELASGRFRAILDVFDVEPLPADSRLRIMAGVTLMPHASGSSCGADVTSLAVEEVARFVRGQPPAHPVTLERFQAMTRRGSKHRPPVTRAELNDDE